MTRSMSERREGRSRSSSGFAGHHAGTGVLLVDAGGVGQHDGHQVARGWGAVDGPLVTLVHQGGQVAAVIDVGMADDDGVEGSWIKGELRLTLAVAGSSRSPRAMPQSRSKRWSPNSTRCIDPVTDCAAPKNVTLGSMSTFAE